MSLKQTVSGRGEKRETAGEEKSRKQKVARAQEIQKGREADVDRDRDYTVDYNSHNEGSGEGEREREAV